jgi:hypothetical protein
MRLIPALLLPLLLLACSGSGDAGGSDEDAQLNAAAASTDINAVDDEDAAP